MWLLLLNSRHLGLDSGSEFAIYGAPDILEILIVAAT